MSAAPRLTGSDDTKLEATLAQRQASANADPQVRVASSRPFVPEYFDPNPMMRGPVPTPPRRPSNLGDSDAPALRARRVATTTEMSAVARAPIAPVAQPAPPVRAAAASSLRRNVLVALRQRPGARPVPARPTSAYAPAAPTLAERGLVSGRGLY